MKSEYVSELFDEVLKKYLSTLKNPRTREEYSSCIYMVCNALKKDFLSINEQDAVCHFSALRDKVSSGKLSRKTFGTRLSCCRSVSTFIESEQLVEGYSNPFGFISFPEIKNEITDDNIPSLSDLDKVMSSAKKSGLMDYLIMALATRMCLSSTSILKLTRDCYREEQGKSFLVILPSGPTKNNHDVSARYVRMPSDVADILKKYLSALTKSDEEGHLFYNERNKPMRLRNLDSRVRKIIEDSGIDTKYTMRDLRNRGIIDMVSAAGENQDAVSDVQDYLGLQPVRMADYVRSAKIVSCCPPADLVNYRLVCP